ncbi:Angiotensin-converting enzyme-like 5 [Homarus americanus]|uniref:Angiotensin-converting enzyme n=1 Tax=Homarus americanus TaxID=6706 RepID=A0A8J5K3R5_HOMAM|nr:Angiotensin-converting enzyme-like 5 [Homarus americanus]
MLVFKALYSSAFTSQLGGLGVTRACTSDDLPWLRSRLSRSKSLGTNTNEVEAINFLRQYDREASIMCNRFMEASWDYNTNLTSFNKRKMLERQMEWSEFHRNKWNEATTFAWKNFTNSPVRRMFSFVTVLGKAALPKEKLQELTELVQDMKTSYSSAKICKYDSTRRRLPDGDYDYYTDFEVEDDNEIGCIPTSSLEPDLTNIMATSRDPEELRYVWRAWREAAGKPLRQKYLRFVELANEAARLNGYDDAGEYWRSDYETDNFREQLKELWDKLRPLYEQLHAYVRTKLREKYGNMWAQTWTHTLDLTVPYRGRTTIDVTNALRRQGYTPLSMFGLAEEFFTSLGLDPMPFTFWQKSMIVKPTDREVVCHASAWDFCNVSTPRHLQAVNLVSNVDDSYETDINFLFTMALDKIAFLPFGYLVDQWRWEVFSGEIGESSLNSRWWDLRLSVQGVSPPVPRDEDDFDPGAKYFVSFIIQFQFHAELCKAADHEGPLHHCDIYRSVKAGKLLKNVLSLGKSRPWTEALSVLTSDKTNKLDAEPILEYFAPLLAWLESQNRGEFIGWRESEAIVQSVTTSNASVVTGVILAFIAVVLVIALIIVGIRKFRNSGKSFRTAPPAT